MRYSLESLRNPALSALEEGLKLCLNDRPDLKDRVLSGEEMSDYVLWMIENYGSQNDAQTVAEVAPAMLFGGDIAELGQSILEDPHDPEARQRLSALYRSSQESKFFQEMQDISAGIFLRYLPAYWREDDYFEVYYAFSGSSPVYFEQETVWLSKGDVLLIPPGVKKACTLPADDCCMLFFMIRKSRFSQVFWAHLTNQNLMSKFFRDALGGTSRSPYLCFSTGGDDWLETLLFRLFAEYDQNRAYTPRLLNALMSTFFLSLLQGYEKTAQVSQHSGLHWKSEYAEILRAIQEDYAHISLRELTGRFGYSERQIIRIIRESTGERFAQLQSRLRMENAARLLSQGATAEQAADAVGFCNLSSFYRAFTQYFGCTTKQYKKRS